MADEEVDKIITDQGNSIPQINQLLNRIPSCCTRNCQQSLSNVSDEELNETQHIQKTNTEPNHEIHGMPTYLNISGVLYITQRYSVQYMNISRDGKLEHAKNTRPFPLGLTVS